MPENPLIEAFRQKLINMGQNERNLGQGVPPPPMYQRPEVNLDPIRIIQSLTGGGQQPQAQAPTPIPAPPMNIASPMENVGLAGQPQAQPQGNGINWQMLMENGIPALSALVGTVAPGTLPAAAGISTGYTGAREKQREREEKRTDKELEEIKNKRKEIKQRAETIVKVASETFKNPDEVLKEIEAIEAKLDIPSTKVGESLKSKSGVEFNSVEEAEAANLPSGTKIKIGGRPATIQ